MRRSRRKSNVRCSAMASSTTPRLLAKWAGRMLSTRTNSSRISWASSVSCSSVSSCKSAGEAILGSNVLMSCFLGPSFNLTAAIHDQQRQIGQVPCCLAEAKHLVPGLLAQMLGACPAFRHPQKTRIGQFTAGCVFLHSFSRLRAAPFNIKQIIGDLKSLAKAAAVTVQTVQQ